MHERLAIGLSCALLMVSMDLLPARADVAPLQVGNTWVYRGHTISEGYYGGPAIYRQQDKLIVTVTGHPTQPDGSPSYTILMIDSLTGRRSLRSESDSEEIAYRDTVLAWNLVVIGSGDSLTWYSPSSFKEWPREMPPPIRSALLYNPYFRRHSRPDGNVSPLEEATRPAWRSGLRDGPIYGGASVTAWYVDDVGLFWMRIPMGSGGCDGVLERELRLVTFNGATIDIGLEPTYPVSSLAKDAKIACGLRVPPHGRISIARKGAALDLLGRVLAAAGIRP